MKRGRVIVMVGGMTYTGFIHICPLPNQGLYHFDMTSLRRPVERGAAIDILKREEYAASLRGKGDWVGGRLVRDNEYCASFRWLTSVQLTFIR